MRVMNIALRKSFIRQGLVRSRQGQWGSLELMARVYRSIVDNVDDFLCFSRWASSATGPGSQRQG
jgi:hypothetical protein